jgi:hypothetical protein
MSTYLPFEDSLKSIAQRPKTIRSILRAKHQFYWLLMYQAELDFIALPDSDPLSPTCTCSSHQRCLWTGTCPRFHLYHRWGTDRYHLTRRACACCCKSSSRACMHRWVQVPSKVPRVTHFPRVYVVGCCGGESKEVQARIVFIVVAFITSHSYRCLSPLIMSLYA